MTSFPGSAAGTDVTLGAGTYSVAESGGPAGYTASPSADCSGTIAAGEHRTCTITNDDQPAHLTVIKPVINDNGGTKSPADFILPLPSSGGGSPTFRGSGAATAIPTLAGGHNCSQAEALCRYG